MGFEPNRYYTHTKGRSIHTLEYVNTIKWGMILIVEETDNTGHSISCVSNDTIDPKQIEHWTEISKEEFMVYFNRRQKKDNKTQEPTEC